MHRRVEKKYIDINYKDNCWSIRQGSTLDLDLLESIGKFDVVYSWGVLHHTDSMWKTIENVSKLVDQKGKFFISIYNDQGIISEYWKLIKFLYNKNILLRYIMILGHFPYLYGMRYLYRLSRGVPLERGMSLWNDMLDWLGGYPFETAKPKDVLNYLASFDFNLVQIKVVGVKHGCNEFLFMKNYRP